MPPLHDEAIPAPAPLVVFGHQFDVLACSARELRYLVRKLEAELAAARRELQAAEAEIANFVGRACNG